MKVLLAVIAGIVAVAGFINFFASLNGQSSIPIGISHPVALLAMAYLLFQHVFPAIIYRGGPEVREQAIQNLQATGTVLAKTTCGGYIGLIQFRGPLLRVEVYSSGILLKPLFMPSVAILKQEIKTIRSDTKWFRELVEISHTSQSVANPIQLECGQGNSVRHVLFTQLQISSPSD